MKFDLEINYDRHKAQEYFDKLMEAGDRIDLKKFFPSKSNQQMRYLNICYKLFAKEAGLTVDEAKWKLKRESGFMIYTKQGEIYPVSAADLDTQGMGLFIDFIINYAKESLNCIIPSSEDYIKYQFEIEKEVQ
jgi:hypothetical protein